MLKLRNLLLLMIVAVVLAPACGDGYEEADNPLGKALLQHAPDGYTKVDGPASGPMTLKVAASSSTADAKEKERVLQKHGFKGGYSRVWRDEARYITALVYQMRDQDAAKEVMIFEFDQLGNKRGGELFPLPQVPGGLGFKLTGIAGREYSKVDCKGVWFSRSNRVFNVNTCGPTPPSDKQIGDLGSKQFALARRTTPVRKESPQPSPGLAFADFSLAAIKGERIPG